MSEPTTWDQDWVDYFIPETVGYDERTGMPDLEHAVMRNLIAADLGFPHGLPDQEIVNRIEAATSIKRMLELEHNPIPGDYDLAHMQRIHRYLFQDVYPWAGELRTAPRDWPMTKLGPDVVGHIDRVSNPRPVHHPYFAARDILPFATRELGRIGANGNLHGLEREKFVDELATVWARVNVIHPFREGNTRTQFAFFRQLAADAGFALDTARYRDAGHGVELGDLRTQFIWGRFLFQQNGNASLLREAVDLGLTELPSRRGDVRPVGGIIDRGYDSSVGDSPGVDTSALRAVTVGHTRSAGSLLRETVVGTPGEHTTVPSPGVPSHRTVDTDREL
ncbi:Fic/DOC family protein [Rhodococcus triatomae]